MKNRRLLPLFVCASVFSTLGFGALAPVSAQPAPVAAPVPAPAKTGKKGKGAKRAGAKGLPKRMLMKVEEKMGKPLTEDQKTRLGAAYKSRMEANKVATDAFNKEAAAITGLSVEDVVALSKRGRKAGAAPAAR